MWQPSKQLAAIVFFSWPRPMSWILGRLCHRGRQRGHAWNRVQPSLKEMRRLHYLDMKHTILVTICFKKHTTELIEGILWAITKAFCATSMQKTPQFKKKKGNINWEKEEEKPQWGLGQQWDRGEGGPRWRLQALLSLPHPSSTCHGKMQHGCMHHGYMHHGYMHHRYKHHGYRYQSINGLIIHLYLQDLHNSPFNPKLVIRNPSIITFSNNSSFATTKILWTEFLRYFL